MSTASPMILVQSEATAARRRMLFHVTVILDGSDATGLTLDGADVTISKNGAAFGNAAGTVTELANGWYQLEFTAADLDTVGALAVRIGEALVDFVLVQHQVVVDTPYLTEVVRTGTAQAGAASSITLDASASATDDLYNGCTIQIVSGTGAGQVNVIADYNGTTKVATVAQAWATNPANDSVFVLRPGPRGYATAAALAALQSDTDEVLVGVQPVRTTNHVLGNLTEDGSTDGLSMAHAVDGTVTVSGTFDGATVTVQFTADTAVDPIVWNTYVDTLGANPLTAAGSVVISGPVQGIRATMSSAGGSSDVAVTLQIRTNQP